MPTTANGVTRGTGPGLRARALLGGLTIAFGCAAPVWPRWVAPVAMARPAPDSFADLAASLLPAVVNVSSSETMKSGDAESDDSDGDGPAPEPSPFPPGSPFEKFFHDYMNRQHGGGGEGDDDKGSRRVQSLGSGFVVDPSGLVVTNNHVIAGADEITVTLQDNTVLKAHVVGHDDRTDLALLQVKTDRKLPAVAFGDSDKSRVGDWVLAIGNPFGLGGTVTAGIVSARGRDIQQGPYDDFIQTDAPINRGNSGGPLFSMDGAVVGINTAIYSPSGGSIGIGFSIPSNEAKLVVDQLRRYGRARRGWIGVRVQAVTPDIAASLKQPGTDGALVAGVDAKGPAANAGLRPGDVILQFNGVPLHEMRTLPRTVAETAIGASVPVAILRAGRNETLHLTVAELPDDAKSKATPPKKLPAAPKPGVAAVASLGLTLAPLDDGLRTKYGVPPGTTGTVVTGVAKDGTAAGEGVKPGDVIVEVEQSDVTRPADVEAAIAGARTAKRPSVLMLLLDKDGQRWVPVPLGSAASATNRGG